MLNELNLLKTVLADVQPRAELTLAPPVSIERTRMGQDELGIEFHKDLLDFLTVCNGQEFDNNWFKDDPIIPEYHYSDLKYTEFRNKRDDVYWTAAGWLIGIERIVDFTLALQQSFLEEDDAEYECFGPAMFHNKYVCILQTLNEYTLCLDHEPKEGGVHGQVVSISSQSRILAVISPSMRHFFKMIADGFSSHQFEKNDPDGYWRSIG